MQGKHPLSSRWSWGPVQPMGRIPVLKLHGSLNWALSPDGGVTKYIDARPSRGWRYEAVLLPPGLSDAPILSNVRDHAIEVLSASRVWVFCGYSMPDYDEDIMSLLKASAVGQLVRVVTLAPDDSPSHNNLRWVIGSTNGDSATRIEYRTGPSLSPDLTSKELVSLMRVS
jgi:hypothetical protein